VPESWSLREFNQPDRPPNPAPSPSRDDSETDNPEIQISESLQEALSYAWDLHKNSGDSVDVNTEALLFGLSQERRARSILRSAGGASALAAWDKQRNHDQEYDLHDVDELSRLQLSSSVKSILSSAKQKSGRNSALDVDQVLAMIAEVHPELLLEKGIAPTALADTKLEDESSTPKASADKETKSDYLGRALYARALAGLIISRDTGTPLSIGVYGPWGQGKSSLMLRVEEELKQISSTKRDIVSVRFNAWKYDQKDTIWAALLHEVLRVYEGNVSKLERGKQYLQMRKLPLALFVIGIGLMTFFLFLVFKLLTYEASNVSVWTAIGGILGLSGIPLVLGLWREALFPLGKRLASYVARPDHSDKLGFQAEVEQEFRTILDGLLRANSGLARRLVVFVDDLDRCRPDAIVEVLESLRVFLNYEDVVIVLGLDERVVSLAISHQYGHIIGDGESTTKRIEFGRDYLEKIIQIPVYLQNPGVEEVVRFALEMTRSSLRTTLLDERKEGTLRFREELGGRRRLLRTLELDQEAREALESLGSFLPKTPRRLKRLLNRYRLLHYLVQEEGESFNGRVALAFLLLCDATNERLENSGGSREIEIEELRRIVNGVSDESKWTFLRHGAWIGGSRAESARE